jgi:hypothetical protein
MKSTQRTGALCCSAVALALFGVGCGQGPGTEPEQQQSSADEAAEAIESSARIPGCTLEAHTPNLLDRDGNADVSCDFDSTFRMETCLQQLVIGGWKTIGFTCTSFSEFGFGGISQTSRQVPFWTRGRWYRTWAWVEVNGSQTTATSGTIKGP